MVDEGGIYEGGCLCGAVRYRARGPAHDAQLCHCRMCQLATGAPFAAFASFDHAGFRFTRGEPAYYRSSPLARRGFCARCGTSLTFEYENVPEGGVGVMIATLDDPSRIEPQVHWGVESMVPWLRFGDDWPRLRTEDDPEWQAARDAARHRPDTDRGASEDGDADAGEDEDQHEDGAAR